MAMKLQDPTLLKTQCYIAGQWQDPQANSTTPIHFAVHNPANGELLAQVTNASSHDAEQAIIAAHDALPQWSALTAKERAGHLRDWFNLIMAHKADLALLMTSEQGKPLAEAEAEIAYAASFIEWFAEEAKRIYGDIIPTNTDNKRLLTIKQPVGVVAAITPWNFPSAMLTRKAAPALAAGCTFVVKPAAETPLSALALVALAERAGIPPGVINVVVGEDSAALGEVLATHPKVRKITFTGSTRVGKILLRQAAQSVKRVSMELGGNAPVLVFEDADIEKAVAGVIASKYRNAGQTCICINRVLVHKNIKEQFIQRLVEQVNTLQIGLGTRAGVDIGPLITHQAVQRVHALVVDALADGANALTGAHTFLTDELADKDLDPNQFYPPTILDNVSLDSAVVNEEIFGPVTPLLTFSTTDEAIALANATEYGLAAYIYTSDTTKAWRISEALEYGMVGVNEVGITSEVIPFGGVKESGLGREGSKYGIDEYLETKYICMGLN
jgi:succinate-semialdehyde dehydrogenase/glutarate-semialdehyde dehydrogenase